MSPRPTAAPGLPPFGQVLKSREVEDPVNLWVHRPLAYAFCKLVYGTSITPNQITLIAIGLGLLAAACWVDGSPWAMVWGGALLWSSAIMDGADGILARAKNMQSAFGRALDGTADMLVGFATVAASIYHLAQTGASATVLVVAVAALGTTVIQLNLYDFYKELHMRMTRLDRGGDVERLAESAEPVVRVQVHPQQVGKIRRTDRLDAAEFHGAGLEVAQATSPASGSEQAGWPALLSFSW